MESIIDKAIEKAAPKQDHLPRWATEPDPSDTEDAFVAGLQKTTSSVLAKFPPWRLMQRTFEEGVRTAMAFVSYRKSWDKISYATREAVLLDLAWLFSKQSSYFYDFEAICDCLDVDAQKIRRGVCNRLGMTKEEIFNFIKEECKKYPEIYEE